AGDSISLPQGKPAKQGERMIRDASLPHIARTGKKGVRILLRLMDEPDRYVSHAALSDAARLRSTGAVKVYICLIRNALAESGYSPDLIETGRHSYRIRVRNFEIITEYLLAL